MLTAFPGDRALCAFPHQVSVFMKKISVVSPCYNEEDNVETCYETVKAIFERDLPGYEREHIFIDN